MQTEEYQITLNVPLSIEEAIVDCLLGFESEYGFSSLPVSSHDHRNTGLSLAEQVTGRQRKIRFEMYLEKSDLEQLLNRLRSEFGGSGITYRILPVLQSGSL